MSDETIDSNQQMQAGGGQDGGQDGANSGPEELEIAKNSLAKLPILGPAMWLYARDPMKKFMFIGDIDGTVLPPVILDQCRLYTKEGIPFAFFTWARVSDEVDQRLRGGEPRIAPHEWQGGEHVWLIDMVAPFGSLDEMLAELRRDYLAGQKISALMPDSAKGKPTLQEWEAV
ncbi:MAG: toxin-activating lysine-acyltransferase [Mariprofundaceae bacterium]